MPTSNLYLAAEVIHLVHEVPHRWVLDVGPGWGKYAVLLREYLNEKPEAIDAVEAWTPYVHEHALDRLYRRVLLGPVQNLPTATLALYDVVLIVDVIEHLPIEQGRELLARIPGRVVLCTPVEWFATDAGLPPTEEHRSHWTADEWDRLAAVRPVEVARQSLGGWLVRLGPLPSAP